MKCYQMLNRSLHTVAPRVAYYRRQHPGQPLPTWSRFTVGDRLFCQWATGAEGKLLEFEDFKAEWLASKEGREVYRHENVQAAKAAA